MVRLVNFRHVFFNNNNQTDSHTLFTIQSISGGGKDVGDQGC